MTPETTWLHVVLAATIPITIIGVIWTRLVSKKGIGVRLIQFVAVATISPSVVLLALNDRLEGEAVAAIFGAVVGYLLSNIAKFDERGVP